MISGYTGLVSYLAGGYYSNFNENFVLGMKTFYNKIGKMRDRDRLRVIPIVQIKDVPQVFNTFFFKGPIAVILQLPMSTISLYTNPDANSAK